MYLDFAVQFTPQYGDSFLEVIRACLMLKMMQQSGKLPTSARDGQVDPDHLLKKTELNCLHSEPNYGVLWFYYKSSTKNWAKPQTSRSPRTGWDPQD